VPERGEGLAAVRLLYTPVVAALPLRVANDLRRRMTGLELSACGAQGIIARGRTDPATPADTTVAEPWEAGEEASSLCLGMAMDGVKSPSDGRWQEPQVATMLVRRLPVQPQAPPRHRRGTPICRHLRLGRGVGEAHQTEDR
jgi:hypothetical protein